MQPSGGECSATAPPRPALPRHYPPRAGAWDALCPVRSVTGTSAGLGQPLLPCLKLLLLPIILRTQRAVTDDVCSNTAVVSFIGFYACCSKEGPLVGFHLTSYVVLSQLKNPCSSKRFHTQNSKFWNGSVYIDIFILGFMLQKKRGS